MNIRKMLAAAICAALLLIHGCGDASAGELFVIRIPMEKGAAVTVRTADGIVHEAGKINALPDKTRWPSYTASAWGRPGTVCASAVNAIHMLVSVEKGQGRTLSLIPQQTIAPAAGPGASVVISDRAGESLFGAWAPPVGSDVLVEKADGSSSPLAADNLPAAGDTLVITAGEYEDMPYIVNIENRPGGRVTAWRRGGPELIARVIRPLGGTGRFEGTLFQRTGAIRANHCGVIDVSTSPNGEVGGFQIIPWDHALKSKEMQHVWDMTQWLVIGAADGSSMMGGSAPLFKNGLVSGPAAGEELWDVWSTYGRKSLVLARYDNGKWQRLKSASGRGDNALKEITELRIYYPFTEEIQK
ncbi:MAG: hypothetical protein K6E42_03575 [Synergistes sp.]|nr:hypothetical protein [Synergistes sp.]